MYKQIWWGRPRGRTLRDPSLPIGCSMQAAGLSGMPWRTGGNRHHTCLRIGMELVGRPDKDMELDWVPPMCDVRGHQAKHS